MKRKDRLLVNRAVQLLRDTDTSITELMHELRALAKERTQLYLGMSYAQQRGEAGQELQDLTSALDAAANALENGNINTALEELEDLTDD